MHEPDIMTSAEYKVTIDNEGYATFYYLDGAPVPPYEYPQHFVLQRNPKKDTSSTSQSAKTSSIDMPFTL